MWYFDTIARMIAPEAGACCRRTTRSTRAPASTCRRSSTTSSTATCCCSAIRVTDRIQFLRDELGVTYLLCWTNFGGLPSDLARDSIRRFAEKIMPRFK